VKIYLINYLDSVFFGGAGAAIAAYRLHQGLRTIGVDSTMLVQTKVKYDDSVIAVRGPFDAILNRLDTLPLRLYPDHEGTFLGTDWIPARIRNSVVKKALSEKPDIVHLHCVWTAFVPPDALPKFNCPVVWTLHDTLPFTGGCVYPSGCARYEQRCGACPQIRSKNERDISRFAWKRKKRAWTGVDLSLVAPSKWMAGIASKSSLFGKFPLNVIAYGVNTEIFKPIQKEIARNILGLETENPLILFGAASSEADKRKGFDLLCKSLDLLAAKGLAERAEVMTFGGTMSSQGSLAGFKTHKLGFFSDDTSLAIMYSCADVFVSSSVEDNLPNTVIEALACGVPCVAFNIGGMPDMIDHKVNGYLAEPFYPEDLARGIAWVLEDENRRQQLSQDAREKALKEYSSEIQAQRYVELYEEILRRASHD
jgi:glycosyltransferase involved in cell wall biosynthesis